MDRAMGERKTHHGHIQGVDSGPFKPASIVEDNAARDEVVVETKTSGHTWLDDDEEDGESKVEEGAEDLVDLFGV